MIKNLRSGGSIKSSREAIKEELHNYVEILATGLESIEKIANLLTL